MPCPGGAVLGNSVGAAVTSLVLVIIVISKFTEGAWIAVVSMGVLFVMMKGDPAADTDAGWTYGVIDPAGKVTDAGRLDVCMSCHEHAQYDRLFGTPSAP